MQNIKILFDLLSSMLSISSSPAFLVKADTALEFVITLSCQFMLGILTEERTVFLVCVHNHN